VVRGLLSYRRFIWQSAVAELRHRYAGTGLGVVWNVLHPLALIAVYSLVFTALMRGRVPGDAGGRFGYVLYLCSGLLPWLAFAECLTRGCNAFTENAIYLRKLPIPEQVFVAKAAASATLGLAISFSLLLAISLALGLRPRPQWLLLPLPLLSMQVLGFGLGLLAGTLNVFFRDVSQLLGVALQVVLWTVPVVYVLDGLGLPHWFLALLKWHPLYPPLEALRVWFLGLPPTLAPWQMWAGMIAWPVAATAAAGAVFGKLRREIRDVL
jgi:ABC-type polysaccharide/polyol phosphate export permease